MGRHSCFELRYGSMYMGRFTLLMSAANFLSYFLSGRPVMIRDEDHDTPLPNVDPVRSLSSTKQRSCERTFVGARAAALAAHSDQERYPLSSCPHKGYGCLLCELSAWYDPWF